MTFLIGGANSAADTGYDIDNSLRFEDGDSPVLTDTLGTPTDIDKFTISLWFKRGNLGLGTCLISPYRGAVSNPFGVLAFSSGGAIQFHAYDDENTTVMDLTTNRVLRDPSAWYHIVCAVDTSQGTAANRAKVYINGVQETSFSTETYPDQNKDLAWNQSATVHYIGKYQYTGATFWDGYQSEFYFIDGTQYAASDFGETDEDSGIWKPIDAKDDLTFGDNGYYLEFKNSAVGTGASDTIGADTSGNDRHFTSTNVAVTDQCTDTPTNNFCTWNPLYTNSSNVAYLPTFSEGNLKLTLQNDSATIGTIGVSKGKWYYEYKFAEDVSANQNYPTTGYTTNSHTFSAANMVGRATPSDSNYDGSTVYRGQMGSTVISAQVFLGIEEADDIIGWYLDLDNETLICHKNGSTFMASGYTSGIDWSSGLTAANEPQDGFFYPSTRNNGHGTVGDEANFGNPISALSSAVSDANGYGSFEFNPTIGGVNYYAICSKNLAKYG